MEATGSKVEIYQGDAGTIQHEVYLPDKNGDPDLARPHALAGYELYWALARSAARTPLLYRRNTLAGGSVSQIAVTDAAAGKCEVSLSSQITRDLRLGPYEYELLARTTGGAEIVLARGKLVVRDRVMPSPIPPIS